MAGLEKKRLLVYMREAEARSVKAALDDPRAEGVLLSDGVADSVDQALIVTKRRAPGDRPRVFVFTVPYSFYEKLKEWRAKGYTYRSILVALAMKLGYFNEEEAQAAQTGP